MSGSWQGGKGSRPRPYSVDQKTFDNNWDNIFGKNKKVEDVPILENEETWSQRVIDENDKKAKE
jgi:hypothetical protein